MSKEIEKALEHLEFVVDELYALDVEMLRKVRRKANKALDLLVSVACESSPEFAVTLSEMKIKNNTVSPNDLEKELGDLRDQVTILQGQVSLLTGQLAVQQENTTIDMRKVATKIPRQPETEEMKKETIPAATGVE